MAVSSENTKSEKPRPERWRREHFIPISGADLVAALVSETEFLPGERDKFLEFCRRLDVTFELESQARLRELSTAYGALDPDADLVEMNAPEAARHAQLVDDFFRHMHELLSRANYEQLSQHDLEESLHQRADWDHELEIDFKAFDRLEVYARGDITQNRARRGWRWLYRQKDQAVPIYQRLAVLFRPRKHSRFEAMIEPRHVYLKLFKNIPRHDLELLLPGSRVRMSLLDQGRIWLPTLSGVALALWKIVQGAVVLAVQNLMGLAALAVFVAGTLGYGVKSYFGYRNTKERHQLTLASRLYYQNLDNNAGVIYRLLEDARQQEFREALLAYFLLWRSPLAAGRTCDDLDAEGEALLRRLLALDVDLEIDDALAKLARLKLAVELPGDRWQAVSLVEAQRQLERLWIENLTGRPTSGPPSLRIHRAA